MASEIVPITPYAPNWSLLTKVIGTKQAEYDRGFEMVKNVYNSLLNKPVTNEENEKFRTEAFKKLQYSLKSIASVDLSNPTNVARATSLMSPIREDEELMYDIWFTNSQVGQKRLLESTKTSMDPKVSQQYNDYSRLDLQLADQRMREAKRGNASIKNIQPGEFIPYQDFVKDLDEEADKSKLSIENSRLTPGYIITDVNGPQAIPSLTQWAKSRISSKYDRQFNQMGRVNAEMKVRDLMDNKKLSREDATKIVSGEFAKEAADEYTGALSNYNQDLTKINDQIKIYDKLYPNQKFPQSNVNAQNEYATLLKLKKSYESEILNTKSELDKINSEGVGNLPGYLTNKIKNKAAYEWGSQRAKSTAQTKIQSDATWVANRNNEVDMYLKNQQISWDREKFYKQYPLDIAKLMLDYEKAKKGVGSDGTGSGTGSSKKLLPNQEYVGRYTEEGEPVPAGEILGRETSTWRNEAFNKTFGAKNGLVNLVVDNQEYNKLNPIFQKLRKIGNDDPNTKLSVDELFELKKYGLKVGMNKLDNPKSASEANVILDYVMRSTYLKASDNIRTYKNADKLSEVKDIIQNFKPTFDAFTALEDESKLLAKTHKNISDFVLGPDGKLKPEFEGVKLIKWQPDVNWGIWDLKSFTPEQMKMVENLVDPNIINRTRTVGNTWKMNNITQPETQLLFNAKNQLIFSEGSDKLQDYLKIDENTKTPTVLADNLSDLFGNTYQVDFGSKTRRAKITFNVDENSTTAKTNKIGKQSVSFYLGFDDISTPGSGLTRLQNKLSENTTNTRMSSIANYFMQSPYETMSSDSYHDNSGFTYDMSGAENANGVYGLNLNIGMKNPKSKQVITNSDFIPIKNINDPQSYHDIQDRISKAYNAYLMGTYAYENSFTSDELVDIMNELKNQQ